MASLAGTTIDKYEMIEEVGSGGMAVVYRGRDRVLEREVAVKVLHPHLADRQESKLRLQREAIAVAKLRHENILEIFDYSGPDADESYIVTEFIHGPTLKEWVDTDLDPRPVVAAMIIYRLCLALTHAHKAAIVHRDIKPENVMIRKDDGVIKLMDFGIAQIIDNQKLTLTGQLIGSPAYMAPELISGKPLDARTDLFSLGILLYQLATGELPFSGRNPHEVLNRIADGEYPAPSTLCPLVDRDLEAIIAKALAVDPDDRYQSVETLGKELEQYCLEAGIEPSGEELTRYFNDPPGYVAELDKRVSAHVMTRAEEAAKNGSTARAIRMLGRVLELDSEHKGARDLLKRLRVRERRVRQMLVVGGAMAVTGLVAAGWMLARPGAEGPPIAHNDLAAPAPHATTAAADDDGTTTGARVPARGASTGGPDPARAETGPPPVADTGDADDETSGGKTRPIRRPIRANPREPTSCKIRLGGDIPLSTAKNLDGVRVAGEKIKVTGLELEVAVKFKDAQAWVTVDDDLASGRKLLTPADCALGTAVVVPLKPRKASVGFKDIPGDTTVICKAGCDERYLGINQSADGFKPIELSEWLGRAVTLQFKHEDYFEKTVTKSVRPGRNTISVELEHR